MNFYTWKWGLLFILLIGSAGVVQALKDTSVVLHMQETTNTDANTITSPIEKNVLQRLSDLEETIKKMKMDGIKTTRISDGYVTAQSFYQAEKFLVDAKKKDNYSDTLKKINEMEIIVDLAYEAKDEISALQARLEQVKGEINAAPVETILKTAKKEMSEERFEKASESALAGEDKIAELQSLDTKAKAAAEAATANVISFLDTNKYIIISFFVVGVIIFLIFKNRFDHYLMTARMHNLELERDTLKNEIRHAQNEFFVKGDIPESIYNIRVKVYGSMIRNTTRKIAVLTERQKKMEFKLFQNIPKIKIPSNNMPIKK